MARVRTKNKRKRLIFLLSVVLFFVFIWLFLTYNVNPVLRKISQEKVKALTTVAVNSAAESVIIEMGYDYPKIIEIIQNDEGEIELLQVNSLLLNLIARRIATISQTNISEMGAQGIAVPIGSLSGLTFLAGRGNDITIKVYPVGSVEIKFASEFSSAGINQTKHKIALTVLSSVSVIMPGANKTIETRTELALCENIIVGKVPDTYLNLGNLNESLNLLP